MKTDRIHILKAGPFRVGFSFDDPKPEETFSSRYRDWITDEPSSFTVHIQTHADLIPGYSPDISYYIQGETWTISSPCFRFTASDSETGKLTVSPDEQEMVDSLENGLRAVLQWYCISNRSFIIHAAGVGLNGKGILFPAKEGGGKSTIAELCFTSGCEVFGDDLVLVSIENGVGMVYGLPFRGETLVPEFTTGPAEICEVMFIQKGNTLDVSPLTPGESAGLLLSNTPFLNNAPSRMLETVLSCSASLMGTPCSLFSYGLGDDPQTIVAEKLNG